MREFLFGKSVGEWKRKNPLRFALLVTGPAAASLPLMTGTFDGSSFAYFAGIWVATTGLIYVPLKMRYWLERRRHS